MFANFLNLAFNSAPSDNTSFTGFVERVGFELEPYLTDSLILEGFLNDSANVA